MIEAMFSSDWLTSSARLLFVGAIYLFLFLVLRSTTRQLGAIARGAGRASATPGGSDAARLVVIEPSGSSLARGDALALEPESVIGRDRDVAVVLDDPHVSARHAELLLQGDQWWLRDLDSRNGTLLNEQPVHSVVAVHSGDVLQCAGVRLRFMMAHASPAESLLV
ncbi:MAG: FHA domain-containing protein [Thermomicrobiales bacterium]